MSRVHVCVIASGVIVFISHACCAGTPNWCLTSRDWPRQAGIPINDNMKQSGSAIKFQWYQNDTAILSYMYGICVSYCYIFIIFLHITPSIIHAPQMSQNPLGLPKPRPASRSALVAAATAPRCAHHAAAGGSKYSMSLIGTFPVPFEHTIRHIPGLCIHQQAQSGVTHSHDISYLILVLYLSICQQAAKCQRAYWKQ